MIDFLSYLKSASEKNNNKDNDIKEEDKKNKTEKAKRKRELLFEYMRDPNSNDETFNNIINEYPDDILFTVNEAFEYAQCNPYIYIWLNEIFNNNNNYKLFYDREIGAHILKILKNNNPYNFTYTKPPYLIKNNPYINEGISNAEFNKIWKELRKNNFMLKDNDKQLISTIYTIDDIKEEIGYNTDSEKYKCDNTDIIPTFKKITTKKDLYDYWNNLVTLYNYDNNSILGDINCNNMNDNLSDIQLIFVTLMPHKDDINKKLLFQNEYDLLNIYNKYLINIPSNKYISINICNNITNDKNIYKKCIINIFDKILEKLPKVSIIIPVNEYTYKDIFGCDSSNNLYKYNNHIIIGAIINNDNETIENIVNGTFKKVSVKRSNIFKTDDIISNINKLNNNISNNNTYENIVENLGLNDLVETIGNNTENTELDHNNEYINNDNDNNIIENLEMNDLVETINIDNNMEYTFSKKKYSFSELNEILLQLKGYNIIYCSKLLNKSKSTSICDKWGTSYIVLRKNMDKRLYLLDPEINIGYTLNSNNLVEENINNLNLITNMKLSDIKWRCKELKTLNPNIIFYNADFLDSTHILSKIRNSFNYIEGNNKPRVAILDFETEKDAIKVRYYDKSINSKCRLFSLLDSLTKVAYCGILEDANHHNNETIKQLQNIKEHEGYKVDIKVFKDEKDLWNHLINLLIEIDPDIITGWNIETFDLIYAIVRCRTLGINFRNKYSNFEIILLNNKKVTVMVDGMVVLDYLKLYRAVKTKKQENYKLDYICQQELKKGKRPMIVNDHDEMYYNHIVEYTLYNIEDSARVFELDNKVNFLQFKYELANVCNVSWDDIFAQTRLIDGLVYKYSMYIDNSLIREKNYSNDNQINNEDEDEEVETGNIKLDLINELEKFISAQNIDIINNGKISLKNYINNTRLEIYEFLEKNKNNKSKNKGYEGAIVLKPQIGLHDFVADLDASQMYPRLMIRSNIFIDTLCAIIAYDNENMAEKWIYDNENFPSEIPLKLFNSNQNIIMVTKEQFREYLKDKILTPFGTIYWKPSVKRSLMSNILIDLIGNRLKYKKLMNEATRKYSELKDIKGEFDEEVIEYKKLIERYDNIQNSYKYLINAIYGVMGMGKYRLSNSYSAASITASGRELTRLVAHFASLYMDEMIKEKRIDIEFEKIPLTFKTLKGFEDVENRKNAIYGDTDSSMFLIGRVITSLFGKDLSEDKIIQYGLNIIERVSEFINKYIIKFVLEKKGIDFYDDDKDFNYEYKKEWIAKKMMLGQSKKQYAMHLIYRNGEKLDEIEIKGMDTIKSDTARYSRDFLNEITQYILKEYDSNNTKLSNEKIISKYNNAVNNIYYLADNGSPNIGRPVSITQDLNDYETIQSSIRGMLLYDIFYDYEFLQGSKGYQFDICQINWENTKFKYPNKVKELFFKKYSKYNWFNKTMKTMTDKLLFSSITIPVDVDKLDTSIFVIDKKELKESMIKKKIEKIMEIIGIKIFDKEDVNKFYNKKVKNTINDMLSYFLNNDDNENINSTI